MMSRRLSRQLRLIFLICIVATAPARPLLADASQSEVESLSALVFPGPVNALMKWPDAVRFAIAADNDQDAALAVNIIADIVDALPGRFRDSIVIERRVPLTDVPLIRERSLIYITSQPYDDLTGPLRPFFETLITNGDDIDQRIDQARSLGAPWQTTYGVNGRHEVVGVLVMIPSAIDFDTKRLMFVGAVAQAICPAQLFLRSDPGLFVIDGEKVSLSQLGRDLFTLMLSEEVRPGMSKTEFEAVARRLL